MVKMIVFTDKSLNYYNHHHQHLSAILSIWGRLRVLLLSTIKSCHFMCVVAWVYGNKKARDTLMDAWKEYSALDNNENPPKENTGHFQYMYIGRCSYERYLSP
eukprot:TRINITY_DN10579_c1_g1_i1.p1 TRINITY_DN10579_c1_g1~~TRINITY_DN10579_c1_g1_i1.p1  ORF type:complete len:103 (+),score=2.35 TRINITY_DN10579_c1_g1_i1:414-722(+)